MSSQHYQSLSPYAITMFHASRIHRTALALKLIVPVEEAIVYRPMDLQTICPIALRQLIAAVIEAQHPDLSARAKSLKNEYYAEIVLKHLEQEFFRETNLYEVLQKKVKISPAMEALEMFGDEVKPDESKVKD